MKNKLSAVEKFKVDLKEGMAKYYSNAISDNIRRVFEKKRQKTCPQYKSAM